MEWITNIEGIIVVILTSITIYLLIRRVIGKRPDYETRQSIHMFKVLLHNIRVALSWITKIKRRTK